MDQEEKRQRLLKVVISPDAPIGQAIQVLDRSGLGILLVCDEEQKLLGVVTDGDIRRAILKGQTLDQPCILIANKQPLTAADNLSHNEILHLMDSGRSFFVNALPIIDEDGKVKDLTIRRDLISEDSVENLTAVIMAGGAGSRLRPLTDNTPKPMLLVGDRPLMERTIEHLRESGISYVNVTTHYKPEKIQEHFGDGSLFGVEINYVFEDRPLGTAGALGLLENKGTSLLVINGDILTKLDYRAMLGFHRSHHAIMTVAVRQYLFQIPYGVLECEGEVIRNITEKPTQRYFVNAGIYLIEPDALKFVPQDVRFDMTDLMRKLIKEEKLVISFPIVEYWLDIGQIEDYEKAQRDVVNGEFRK